MADRKITELTAMSGGTQAAGDLLTIVDVSEAAAVDKNKKITLQNLFEAIPGDVGIVGGSDVRLELGTTGTTNTNNRNHVRGEGSSLKYNTCSGGSHSFEQNGTERMRIDSSGRLLVGSGSTREVGYGDNASLQLEGTSYPKAAISSILNSNNANGPSINFAKSRGTSNGTSTVVQNNDILGLIAFSGGDGTDIRTMGARIQASVDGTPSSNDMPGRLMFSTTADGAASPTERLRLDSSGRMLVGYTSNSGDALLQVNGPIRVQGGAIFASHSRAYTASTTAAGLFGIQMTTGHGFAEFTWAFVDAGYPNGVRMGKIYITFRGSGSNITAVTSTYTTENSITNGSVATISWVASVGNVSNIRLNATASTTSGSGTMYLYGSSPFFSGLNPIANA